MRNTILLSGIAVAVALVAAPLAAQEGKKDPAEVALIGCVEMEKDYRARMEAGKGGVLGTGVGVDNEFVLVNAKAVPTPRGQRAAGGPMGGDYSLTGRHEPELLRAVGRQVEIVGTVEPIEAHTSAKDAKSLPRLTITLWHPVADFCPAEAAQK